MKSKKVLTGEARRKRNEDINLLKIGIRELADVVKQMDLPEGKIINFSVSQDGYMTFSIPNEGEKTSGTCYYKLDWNEDWSSYRYGDDE